MSMLSWNICQLCYVFHLFLKKMLQYTSSDSTGSQLCSLGHPSCFRAKGRLFKILYAVRRCGNSLTVMSHLTNHFSFIWIGSNMITQLVECNSPHGWRVLSVYTNLSNVGLVFSFSWKLHYTPQITSTLSILTLTAVVMYPVFLHQLAIVSV